ncbi:glycosyltransferase [Streptomyces sp. NPDC001380]|uniref:glycosyltransferase n=1 Tax=Streptomyces sp. NPDC001380 TaxID=3364566 RepID=UPI00368117F4
MIRAIAVVVPARDEERLLGGCLASVRRAARHPRVAGLPVRLVVVADSCQDRTAAIARHAGAEVATIRACNVGAARARGTDRALAEVLSPSRGPAPDELWLAHTDADTRVPYGWLARQLSYAEQGWDAVVGTVQVLDWSEHPPGTAERFQRQYATPVRPSVETAPKPTLRGGPRAEHPHVHGANLGVRADAYRSAGGFAALAVGEDHALVAALEALGRPVRRAADLPVITSARRGVRARGGFGDTISALSLPAALPSALAVGGPPAGPPVGVPSGPPPVSSAAPLPTVRTAIDSR